MPWLTATAFLHSAMVQERRGMLRVWNVSLITSTFLLTILGTFLTRSGVLSSDHAFSEGPIGYYFLGFIGVVLLFSLVLVSGRSSEMRTDGNIDDPLSRETVFLVNNLLFATFTFTVLLGTLFPLAPEALRGVKVSLGAPFFNRMTVPLCAALLFLLGVGPVLPWRGATADHLKRHLLVPSMALLVTAVVSFTLGMRNAYGIAAFAFAAFSLSANVQEYVFGAAARRRAHGEGWLQALFRLIGANNRRYGGYLAHIGVIIVAAGITASSAFRAETPATLRPGESVDAARYTVRFDRMWARNEPQRVVVGADLTAFIGTREIGKLVPRLNF
jgi:cytochrome c-type biogenesis protein CcmF